MNSRSTRPIGVVLSSLAAVIFAAPTLAFPADSPIEPKLAFAAAGAVVFALSVLRIRQEPAAGTRAPRDREDLNGP